MNLNTLLEVLFANGQEALVALAVKLDNNITTEIPQTILVNLTEQELPEGKTFSKNGKQSRTGCLYCTVISYNKYKLNSGYTISLPNGQLKQHVEPYKYDSELAIIIDKPSITEDSMVVALPSKY